MLTYSELALGGDQINVILLDNDLGLGKACIITYPLTPKAHSAFI